MEAVYLSAHLFFVLHLLKRRQPSPVYYWFVLVTLGLWGIVGGDLFENCLYLFDVPGSAGVSEPCTQLCRSGHHRYEPCHNEIPRLKEKQELVERAGG